MITLHELKKAILAGLAEGQSSTSPRRHAHKISLLGRPYQRGEIEHALDISFELQERALADRAFLELKRDGYVRSTYRDLTDPENWVEITDAGLAFLTHDLKDTVDLALEAISPHLLETRRGMWDAIERTSPDASRQASHSARELIDQVLKTAPAECKTRKARFRHLMYQRHGSISSTNLELLEANADLLEAEHNAMVKNAHLRGTPSRNAVLASVHAAERILSVLFEPSP